MLRWRRPGSLSLALARGLRPPSLSRAKPLGVCASYQRVLITPPGRQALLLSLSPLLLTQGKRRSFSLDGDFYSSRGWFRGRPSLGGARVEIRSRRLVFLEGCARWDQQARLNGEPTRDEDMFSTRDEGRKSARVRPDSPKFEFFDSCSFKSCRLLRMRQRKSLTFPLGKD